MSTGTSREASGGEKPEEPQPDRETRSTRKKLIEASLQVAASAAASTLGGLAGQALAKLLGF